MLSSCYNLFPFCIINSDKFNILQLIVLILIFTDDD